MIDIDKVVKGLECCKTLQCTKCPYYTKFIRHIKSNDPCPMYDDALALLHEQHEVKQIIRRQAKREHSDGSIDYFAEWYCPHCNLLLTQGFATPQIKYCYKCGKPVKWDA